MKKLLPLLIIVVVAAIVGVGAYTYIQDKQATNKPFGGPLDLIAMDGSKFTETNLRETPAVVFFGFTHCPDVCPTTLFELDGWFKEMGPDADKIKAYFITIDPERDTQEIMQTYVTNVSDKIIGITGTPEKIAEAVKSYHIYAKKVPGDDGNYTMDHTASLFLLDKGGMFRGTIAYGENPDTALEKLKNLAKRNS